MSSDGGEHVSRRRRHHHRSRSRRRRHHRSSKTEVKREEGVDDARPPAPAAAAYGSYPPATWGVRPEGPPAGWHGSAASAPPPAGYPLHPPIAMHAGHPPFGHLPPHMSAPRPPHAEAARDDPYGSPFAAVPPPADLDASSRKGKGKDDYAHFNPGPHYGLDGVIVSNVPEQLNTLDSLNRHFRQFGEVLKITVHASEARAFVQFADQKAAASASGCMVLDKPEITLQLASRDKGKGKSKGKGKDRPEKLDKPAEHRTLWGAAAGEEQKRYEVSKRKRDELDDRRRKLLSAYTEQIKVIMEKMSADNVSEEKREAFRAMIIKIKEKMTAFGDAIGFEETGKGKAFPKVPKGQGKGEGKDGGKAERFTLDLRSKVMRINVAQGAPQEKIKEELAKYGVSEDKILCLHLEGVKSDVPKAEGEEPMETALLQFKDRHSGDAVFKDLKASSFAADWSTDLPPVQTVTVEDGTTEPLKAEDPSVAAAAGTAESAAPEAAPAPDAATASTAAAEAPAEAAAATSAEPASDTATSAAPAAEAAAAATAEAVAEPAADSTTAGSTTAAEAAAPAAAEAAPAAEQPAAPASAEADEPAAK